MNLKFETALDGAGVAAGAVKQSAALLLCAVARSKDRAMQHNYRRPRGRSFEGTIPIKWTGSILDNLRLIDEYVPG